MYTMECYAAINKRMRNVLNTNTEITTNYIVKWKKQNIAWYVCYPLWKTGIK